MDNFYAEKLWQKVKEQWLIDESTENYEKILDAFVFGVNHVPEGYALVPMGPTEAMFKAGNELCDHTCDVIYEAMIQEAQEQE